MTLALTPHAPLAQRFQTFFGSFFQKRTSLPLLSFWRLLIITAFTGAWELTSRLAWVDNDLLPPFSRVVRELGTLVAQPSFQAATAITLAECLIAFVIVIPIGLVCGFVLGESQRIDRRVGPVVQMLMTTPKSLFLPLFIFAFGIGVSEKVIFAVVLAVFMVIPAGRAAVQSVPTGWVTASRAFGATRGQIYTQVYLPAVAPIVLGGVRLGLIFTIHGVILAEMYASTGGLGRLILDWGESYDMLPLLAAVLLVLLVTVALNQIMQIAEDRLRARMTKGRAA